MNKPYKLAVVCGRFQPLQNGHVDIIKKALISAEKVGLYLGSSNNTGTTQNPLSYADRLKLVYAVFNKEINNGQLIVKALFDRDNPADDLSWGKYYLDCIKKDFGSPDLFVYGNDKERNRWFTEEDLIGIDTLIVNRASISISATQIRQNIDNYEFFKQYSPKEIWTEYHWIKNKINGITNAFN